MMMTGRSRKVGGRSQLPLVVGMLALGLLLAYPLTRFIQGMLHGVEPSDPLVLLGLVVSVMLVATTAALVPALRAVRADPMTALRSE